MDQRRKFKRLNVHIPIHCTLITRDGKRLISRGLAFDLSLGGLKIKIPLPPQLTDLADVKYYLDLPQPFVAIAGQGKIKWVERVGRAHLVIGLEFADLNNEQWSDLLQLVLELNRP